MFTTNFHASVKYGDFKGTASADRHDDYDLNSYLLEKELIQETDFVVGVEFSTAEVSTRTLEEDLYVTVYVVEHTDGYDTVAERIAKEVPLPVRCVRVQIPPLDFFGLFKRFEVAISPGGLIDGKDISYSDD